MMIGMAWVTSESALSADLQAYSLDRKSINESASRLKELSCAQPYRGAQIVEGP